MAGDNIPPMTMEEIQAEVNAVRVGQALRQPPDGPSIASGKKPDSADLQRQGRVGPHQER